MKALVCGGREFANRMALTRALDEFHQASPITCVVSGGARGADKLGEDWAKAKGLPVIRMDANWDYYGKAAGGLRNQWMLDFAKPDVVIAFPGGVGTLNMRNRATGQGVRVVVPLPHPDNQ